MGIQTEESRTASIAHHEESFKSGSHFTSNPDTILEEFSDETSLKTDDDNSSFDGPGTNNSVGSAVLFINEALGAGIINFPYAYKMAGGIASALGIQLIFGLLAYPPQLILAFCADQVRRSTYHEVISVCGKLWSVLAAIVIMLFAFGVCTTYQITIVTQADNIFEAFLGTDFHKYWYTHRAFILAVTSILLIAPFIFPKKIEFIKYVSFLGTFAVTYLAVLIVIEYLATENESGPVPTKPEKISDIIFLIPTICFAYQCHMGSVPIYAGLQNRNLLKYGTIVGLVFIFVTIIYAMAGIFGLLTFGSKVNHDISRGYDAKRPEVITLNAAIFLAQIATYPLICFCGREAARNLLLTSINKDRNDLSSKEEFWYRIILSSIWLLTTTILAIFVPNVTVSIRAVGGLAALLIFFFPGLCLIFVLQQKRDALTSVGISGRILPAFWILAVFYVFFGIILFVGTTMKSVYEIVNSRKES